MCPAPEFACQAIRSPVTNCQCFGSSFTAWSLCITTRLSPWQDSLPRRSVDFLGSSPPRHIGWSKGRIPSTPCALESFMNLLNDITVYPSRMTLS